jgi:hypothetical protein
MHPQDAEIRAFLAKNPKGSISVLHGVDRLNASKLSLHIAALELAEGVSLSPGLKLGSLVLWAVETLPLKWAWAEYVAGAVAIAERDNPEELYENLAEAEGWILDSDTLEEAARAVLRVIADYIPADSYL